MSILYMPTESFAKQRFLTIEDDASITVREDIYGNTTFNGIFPVVSNFERDVVLNEVIFPTIIQIGQDKSGTPLSLDLDNIRIGSGQSVTIYFSDDGFDDLAIGIPFESWCESTIPVEIKFTTESEKGTDTKPQVEYAELNFILQRSR